MRPRNSNSLTPSRRSQSQICRYTPGRDTPLQSGRGGKSPPRSAIGRVADVRLFSCACRHPHFNREALDAVPGASGSALGTSATSAADGTGRPGRPTRPGGSRRSTPPDSRVAPFAAVLDELSVNAEQPGRRSSAPRQPPGGAIVVQRGRAERPGLGRPRLLGPCKVEPHALVDFARVRDGRLTYPAEPLFPKAETLASKRAGTHGPRTDLPT